MADIREPARAAQEGGADAVALINHQQLLGLSELAAGDAREQSGRAAAVGASGGHDVDGVVAEGTALPVGGDPQAAGGIEGHVVRARQGRRLGRVLLGWDHQGHVGI